MRLIHLKLHSSQFVILDEAQEALQGENERKEDNSADGKEKINNTEVSFNSECLIEFL